MRTFRIPSIRVHRAAPACSCLLLMMLWLLAATPSSADPVDDAEGLWEYTGLVTRDGQSLPLTGVFLISEGVFVQQSIFNEEPFATAGSMAHVGPYWAGGAGMRLTSNQTLSLDPKSDAPVRSAGVLQHDLKVERDGDNLTLTFGAGTSTVQTFRRLGAASDTRLVKLKDGALALADEYFILVVGNESRVVSGYGTYEQNGPRLALDVIRWAESDGATVVNERDVELSAELVADALVLGDGRRIPLAP